jgi:spore coat protein CotH
MRARSRIILTAAIGLAVVLAAAGPAAAQTATELFDPTVMQEIRLSVNSRDLRALHEKYLDNTYYTADLTWKNIKVRNVGIRSRGQGSRNPTKLGLRVDMSRYTTGQTFVGLGAIVLDNLWQDDSLIRERLAFTFFDRLGLGAPRESYCRLFINNEYQGLYTITEEIDGPFAQRVTGETGGTVFEFHYSSALQWRGEDLGGIEAYKPLFEARTHELDADTILYTPIQQLFREVNGPDDAVWRDRVEQYIDLNGFMTYIGIEQFTAENDGILGFAGMNNFYLYRSPNTTKHRLFVWDKDQSFLFIDSPIATTDANVLFSRAMAYPDLRETYLQTIEQCARISQTDDFLVLEVDRLAGLVFDAARADTRKQFSNDRFDEAVQFLREFAAGRPRQVLDEVARIRKGS